MSVSLLVEDGRLVLQNIGTEHIDIHLLLRSEGMAEIHPSNVAPQQKIDVCAATEGFTFHVRNPSIVIATNTRTKVAAKVVFKFDDKNEVRSAVEIQAQNTYNIGSLRWSRALATAQ